jgi:cell division protein FtsW
MVLFGLLMVYSSSFIFAEERTGDGFTFIKKQLLYAVMGFGALFFASRIPHQRWYQWAPLAVFTVLAMLVAVMIPGVGSGLSAGSISVSSVFSPLSSPNWSG